MTSDIILGNVNLKNSESRKSAKKNSSTAHSLETKANNKRQQPNIIVKNEISSKNRSSNAKTVPNLTPSDSSTENSTRSSNLDEKKSFQFQKSSKLFDENSINLPVVKSVFIKDQKFEQIFSEKKFSDLHLDRLLVACLQQRFNFTEATKVQALTIPILLQGQDALIKSVTGSGKTLSYCIPMIQCLQSIQPKITRLSGLFAIIILPTRELAIQTYDFIDRLLNPFRRVVAGLIIGGEKKKSEKARIRKGINIMVTTPGRLLDHINRTRNLKLDKLRWLVIDEADRLYEQGFSEIIGQIIENIKSSAIQEILQTVLISATLSDGVRTLAGLSLRSPKLIDVGDFDETHLHTITLPKSLSNNYMILPAKLRLVMLTCLIVNFFKTQKNLQQKIIVFTSCQDIVDFYAIFLDLCLRETLHEDDELRDDMKIFKLHGDLNQDDRTKVFKQFHSSKLGILFCTDVASRGLDLPNVDLVIQMSLPAQIEDFVHRVGRTARLERPGRSILLLLPSEIKFIEYIQENIAVNFVSIQMEQYFSTVNSFKFSRAKQPLHTDQERLAYLQHIYESIASQEENRVLAIKAFQSYIRMYASYPRQLNSYLPFQQIHLGHIAKSFALIDPPKQFVRNLQKHRRPKFESSNLFKRKIMIPIEERISEYGDLGPKKIKI
ncbi:hypothetical protein NH340_JMT08893 [Sarcoptes scabiei]|nr:hypothetical protein NH340_JMT08893 [Sarcoptes scabiei]